MIKQKTREKAIKAIYTQALKDTRNAIKSPMNINSKDMLIDTKLILLRASLDTYPLI